MRRVGWLCAVVWLAIAGGPAAAQDEAAQIKQGIEASLQQYAKINAETLYSFAGVDVAGDGAGYAVTITDLRVAPGETGYLAVGDVRFRLAAAGGDAYRVSDVVLAERMPVRKADGSEDGAMTIGSQQFTGLWSRSLGLLTEAGYAYTDVKAADAAGQFQFAIGSITGNGTGVDKGTGLWDSQSSFRVADISATDSGETATIAAIEGNGTATGVKMSVLSGLPGRLWAILASLDSPTPPPEFFQIMTDLYGMSAGLDATYKVSEIRVRDAAGSEYFALPELAVQMRGDGFDKDAGNATMVATLNGMRVIDAGTVSIGGLEYRSVTNGFKISQYLQLMQQMQALGANPEAMPGPALLIDMFAGMFTLATGGDTEIRLRDAKYDDATGGPVFSLAQGALLAHVEGLDQPMARASLTLNHQGLNATAPDPSMQDFVPTESNIVFQLENMPVQEIIAQTRAAAPELASLPPEQQDMAGFMLLGIVQQAMTQAKSQLKFPDWRIRSTATSIDLNGLIETSMEAMMGAVANAQISVTGLDRLVDMVKSMSGPDSDDAAGLDVLRGFSNRETAADGAVIDRYDVAFTPQGQLLINGKDFPLMGPGGGDMPMGDGAATDPNAPPPADGSSDGTTTGN